MQETFALITQNAAALTLLGGFVLAVVGFCRWWAERTEARQLKRLEKYEELSRSWEEDENVGTVIARLAEGDGDFSDVSFAEKEGFLSFYEEIALLYESRLIRHPVAFHMFGYYAVRCWESDNFWNGGLKRDLPYWHLFKRFALAMQAEEQAILSGKQDISRMSFKL